MRTTSHVEDGYWLQLTPEYLRIGMANGQLSTDSINARQQADRTSDASPSHVIDGYRA